MGTSGEVGVPAIRYIHTAVTKLYDRRDYNEYHFVRRIYIKIHELIEQLEHHDPDMVVVTYPIGCGCCTFTAYDDIESVRIRETGVDKDGSYTGSARGYDDLPTLEVAYIS